MHRLKEKVAIVTGSSSGIGKAIALRFGAEEANVVVTARRMALCEQTVAQITKNGGEAWAIQTDVADERQVERLIEETVKRYGRLDILVNNAGVIAGGRLAETTTKEFDEVMNVNLRGTFFCCRAGFKQMKKQGGGIIINMSSVAGVQAWAGTGTYSASKHGIMALTKSLADEGRPHHIRVSAICPGGVADGDGNRRFREDVGEQPTLPAKRFEERPAARRYSRLIRIGNDGRQGAIDIAEKAQRAMLKERSQRLDVLKAGGHDKGECSTPAGTRPAEAPA